MYNPCQTLIRRNLPNICKSSMHALPEFSKQDKRLQPILARQRLVSSAMFKILPVLIITLLQRGVNGRREASGVQSSTFKVQRSRFKVWILALLWLLDVGAGMFSAIPAPAQNAITNAPSRTIRTSNAPPPFQIITTSTPPLPPSRFNPDAGVLPPSINIVRPEASPQRKWETNSVIPPKPPPLFDPDPGAMLKAASTNSPFFKQEIPLPPGFKAPPVPQGLE